MENQPVNETIDSVRLLLTKTTNQTRTNQKERKRIIKKRKELESKERVIIESMREIE